MPRFERLPSLRGAALGVLPAWLAGVLVMLGLDAGIGRPVVNTVALALGVAVLAAAGPSLHRLVQARPGVLGLVVVALHALPFAFEPMDGVYRWVGAGPVRLHASAIFAPLALLCLVSLLRQSRAVAAILLLASLQCVLVAQPDAGQASAIALAGVLALLLGRPPRWATLVGVVIAIAGTVVAWSRPDPLEPVAFVEDMTTRAFELGAAPGIASLLALASLPGGALLRVRTRPLDDPAKASVVLGAYFVATIGVTLIGHFPVPVLGYGASPILGAVLGLGLVFGSSD